MCCVLGEVPLTGQKRVRGSNQCISGGGTPNRCPDTDSHAILRHSFFLTIGAKLISPTVPTVFLCAYPRLSAKKFRARMAYKRRSPTRSTPLHLRLPLLMRISLSQSRSLPASDRHREILA